MMLSRTLPIFLLLLFEARAEFCNTATNKYHKYPFSSSLMCRCFNRPFASVSVAFVEPPPQYKLEMVPFHHDHANDSKSKSSVCVFFSQQNVTHSFITYEFIVEAVNEHGWPVGWWEVVPSRDNCELSGRRMSRTGLHEKKYYNESIKCFRQDVLGQEQKYFTEGSRPQALGDKPRLFQFTNVIRGNRGVLMLFHPFVNPDDPPRPQKIRFVAETYYKADANSHFASTRIYSPTYSVNYQASQPPTTVNNTQRTNSTNTSLTVTVNLTTPDVELNLDYSYQAHLEKCLPTPEPPPEIPRYPENTCRCFVPARRLWDQNASASEKLTKFDHLWLNVSANISEIDLNDVIVPPELSNYLLQGKQLVDRYRTEGNDSESVMDVVPYTTEFNEHYLVVIYPFLPAYKDREWKEREVTIQDIRTDTGMPVGRWLSPHLAREKIKYEKICNEVFSAKYNSSAEKFGWIKPPYPAVGECTPIPNFQTRQYTQPCYFHFHSDWFFVDCITTCEKPKLICAVWFYEAHGATVRKPNAPFEFQFIATSIFYKNIKPESKQYVQLMNNAATANQEIVICEADDQLKAQTTNADIRPWNMMEHHFSNYGYSQRSDLWKYTGNSRKMFKPVDISSNDSDAIQSLEYYKRVHQTDLLTKKSCIPPATFYKETQDNNLCICTFWKDNLATWQTHYGRKSSCILANRKPFDTIFSVSVFNSTQYQSPTEVRIRAGISPDAGTTLEQENLVIRAIIIQAIDQHGLPVGDFDAKSHWYPADDVGVTDLSCARGLYPNVNDYVLRLHPIFSRRDCPWSKKGAFLPPEVYGNAPPKRAGGLFILNNQWKDPKYDHVCTTFNFVRKDFPASEQIQYLAFLRLEEKSGNNAYRIELRSDWFNASDLRTINMVSKLGEVPPGQDPMNSYQPLNYKYFNEFQKENSQHYYREECLEGIEEPKRLFELCRHYETTPKTKFFQRWDLDLLIDDYNKYCILYTRALQAFSSEHSYTVEIGKKLEESKVARDIAIAWKKCFTLKAFKHKRKNSFHVMFRLQEKAESYCSIFAPKKIREAAIMALNELGYPIGYKSLTTPPKAGQSTPPFVLDTRGSFVLFNHYRLLGTSDGKRRDEFCEGDDIQLTLDDVVDEDRMISYADKSRCFFSEGGAYAGNPAGFRQTYSSEADLPSLFVWGSFNKDTKGFCVHWNYDSPQDPNVKDCTLPNGPPCRVQFIMEVQIKEGSLKNWGATEKLSSTTKIGRGIVVIRSAVYELKYTPAGSYGYRFDEAYANHECHQEEADIYTDKRPNDNCVCDLVPLEEISNMVNQTTTNNQSEPQTTTTNATVAQGELCSNTYENYIHRLDNTLYRACLTQERDYAGVSDLGCKTKIHYPSPPEVFPSEIIYLTPDGPNPVFPNITLDSIDPTFPAFEGCGYYKDCITRFADPKVEEECLEGKSCDMIVTFGKALAEVPVGQESILEIFAVARGWAAVGISHDNLMGDDYVIECTKEGGEVNLYNSWNFRPENASKERYNRRMTGDNSHRNNIRSVQSVFFDDRLYCKFYVENWFTKIDPESHQERKYDLTKPYHYIMAFSNELPEPYGENTGNIKTHMVDGAHSNGNKSRFITASIRYSPLPIQARFFRIHGLLQVFSWILCTTMTIFVARYYKETLVNTFYFKLTFWYFWHLFGAFLGLLCLLGSYGFLYLAMMNWTNKFRSNFHTYTGYVGYGLYGLSLISGIFCKKKRNIGERKHIVNFVHCVVGHVCYNLAVLNLALAARIPYGFLTCPYRVYIWVWAIIYVIVNAIMTYHYWWIDFILGRRIGSRRYFAIDVLAEPEEEPEDEIRSGRKSRKSIRLRNTRGSLRFNQVGTEARNRGGPFFIREAPGTWVRIFCLCVFMAYVIIYTFWISRKLVTYPRHCYEFEDLKRFEIKGILN